jgi:hypothetical protein
MEALSYNLSEPYNSNIQEPDNWQEAVGNPHIKTEFSQDDMNYSLPLALEESSFSPRETDENDLIRKKVFVIDKLRNANIVGADVSDFKVQIDNPTNSKWASLRQYIYDRKAVTAGEKRTQLEDGTWETTDIVGSDDTYNTIDVGVLLLKGTDTQIKELMRGTYYDKGTVFIADKAFNDKIHERLDKISTTAQKEYADTAENNYKGLRQESVALFDRFKNDSAPTEYGSPYTTLQGTMMGDSITKIPNFRGEMATPLVELRDSRSQEDVQREKAFQALHGLIERNKAINTIDTRLQDPIEKDKELQKLLKDSSVTFVQDQQAEYQVKITANATKAYACLSTSELEDYAKERFPDGKNPEAEVKLIKELRKTGIAVHEHSSAQNDLVVTGIMFNHTPSYGAADDISTLAQGDYLVAEDNDKKRYLIPLTDGVGNVEFGLGERANRAKDVQNEIASFEELLNSFSISNSRKTANAGDIRMIS